ncbi:MAG: metal-binding protein [Ahrensia sp.]|nr:metal-binding protein [Ahrensia sp.]
MSYRIRPGKPLTDEVVRIADHQYRQAMDVLYREPDGRHEAIHDARKRFKRLRGLFRLVRYGAPDVYADQNARLRDTARTLSAVRDATALVEALDRLSVECAQGDHHATLLAIRHRLAARRDRIAAGQTDLHARVSAAIASCEDGIDALAGLSLPKGRKKAIRVLAKGAAKNYGRAQDALHRACETGDPTDWHDLRKRIKYHWMHMKLLRPAWPGVMNARAEVADLAGEALGDDHDLAVLEELVRAEPDAIGDAGEIAVLRACMKAHSLALHERIGAILRHLLHDDPDVFRSRIQALYRDAAD